MSPVIAAIIAVVLAYVTANIVGTKTFPQD